MNPHQWVSGWISTAINKIGLRSTGIGVLPTKLVNRKIQKLDNQVFEYAQILEFEEAAKCKRRNSSHTETKYGAHGTSVKGRGRNILL